MEEDGEELLLTALEQCLSMAENVPHHPKDLAELVNINKLYRPRNYVTADLVCKFVTAREDVFRPVKDHKEVVRYELVHYVPHQVPRTRKRPASDSWVRSGHVPVKRDPAVTPSTTKKTKRTNQAVSSCSETDCRNITAELTDLQKTSVGASEHTETMNVQGESKAAEKETTKEEQNKEPTTDTTPDRERPLLRLKVSLPKRGFSTPSANHKRQPKLLTVPADRCAPSCLTAPARKQTKPASTVKKAPKANGEGHAGNGRESGRKRGDLDGCRRGWQVSSPPPMEPVPPDQVLWDCGRRPVVLAHGSELGYHYCGTRHSRLKVEKNSMEDKLIVRQVKCAKAKCLVLVLADGHNGDEASTFFAREGATRMEQLMKKGDSKGWPWDFSDPAVQEEFRTRVVSMYSALDRQYLDHKRQEFATWVKMQSQHWEEPSGDSTAKCSGRASTVLCAENGLANAKETDRMTDNSPLPTVTQPTQANTRDNCMQSTSSSPQKHSTAEQAEGSRGAMGMVTGAASDLPKPLEDGPMDVSGTQEDFSISHALSSSSKLSAQSPGPRKCHDDDHTSSDDRAAGEPPETLDMPAINDCDAVPDDGKPNQAARPTMPQTAEERTGLPSGADGCTDEHSNAELDPGLTLQPADEMSSEDPIVNAPVEEADQKLAASIKQGHTGVGEDLLAPVSLAQVAVKDRRACQADSESDCCAAVEAKGSKQDFYLSTALHQENVPTDNPPASLDSAQCCEPAVSVKSELGDKSSTEQKAIASADEMPEACKNDTENAQPVNTMRRASLASQCSPSTQEARATSSTMSNHSAAGFPENECTSSANGHMTECPSSTTLLSNLEALRGRVYQWERPKDDGCTLVINVLFNGWLVNCNVGDSRTIVAARPACNFRWGVIFASQDQSLQCATLVEHAVANGGEFVEDHTGRVKTFRMPQVHYHSLKGCRVRPRPEQAANSIGVPTERAINLGATMGDLLFKLHPDRPVLCNRPEVSFTAVPDEGKTLLLMASDGLFNYLPEDLEKEKLQNDHVVGRIGYEYDVGHSLASVCARLVRREERNLSEYDDCMCLLLCVEQWEQPIEPPSTA